MNQADKDILKTAKDILDHNIDMLEGVQIIQDLRLKSTNASSPCLIGLLNVKTELPHALSHKTLYADDHVEKKEREHRQYLEEIKVPVRESCTEIIELYEQK